MVGRVSNEGVNMGIGGVRGQNVYITARRVADRIGGPTLLTLTSFVSAGVSFVVNILTARVLGPDGRGAVALVLQLAYISAPIAVFGFPRAQLRSGPGAQGLVGGGRTWLVLALLLLSPIVVFAYELWYFLFVPAAIVAASFQILRSRAIVESSYKVYITSFLAYQASILVGSVILALVHVDEWQWWAVVYFFPSLAVLAISHGAYRKSLNPLLWIRSNWAFAWSGFSHIVIMRADRLALAYFSGSGPLGLYVVVATAIEPIYWVVQSLSDTRTSHVYRNARGKKLVVLVARESIVFGIAAAVGGVVLWYLIVPIFGSDYEAARPLIFPLTVASVFLVLYRQASGIALVRGDTRVMGISEALLALTAIGIYCFAASWFGAGGVAWGSSVVYFLGFVVLVCVAIANSKTNAFCDLNDEH